jgi:mannose/cellobiose epimerase-like protein (N-acyl-D-glucosamine 2-epimerase family)
MTVSEASHTDHLAALADVLEVLAHWLRAEALPLWAQCGVDRTCGGFYEKLTHEGVVVEEPRRTRLVARQIYVFAIAGESGWLDAASSRDLVSHGLDFLLQKSFGGAGLLRSAVGPCGEPLRPDFDLYDHAFALFALGTAARLGHRPEITGAVGQGLVNKMVKHWKHPLGGFEEAKLPRAQINSSPHMHLLEAFLEWEAVGAEHCWRELSDDIAQLAVGKFIDPCTGGIGEHFDHDWKRAAGETGRFLEPGHHFEWAWLLWRWGVARIRHDDVFPAVRRLTDIAETHGVNPDSGLAINGLWDDFGTRDRQSRLWPQTERLKANIAVAEISVGTTRELALRRATEAAAGLRRYFDTDISGLWHETIDERGRPVPGPAKASSLYHIVGAVREIDRFMTHHKLNG